MTRPDGVKTVVPVNTAEFRAVRWGNDGPSLAAIEWLGDQYGWRVGVPLVGALHIWGRNRKRYVVHRGDWVIALGTNGSLRVCSDKQYRQDYREASE